MKQLSGGLEDPGGGGGGTMINMVGYRGPDSNGRCWCDICTVGAPNNIACEQSCPVSACGVGSIDPNAWCTHGGTPPQS